VIEYLKSNLRYARYIALHKWFVFHAGLVTGAPLWRLIIHDWSKLLPSEWPAYRNHFYPPQFAGDKRLHYTTKAGGQRAFDEAWNLHLHRNAHHWQYWVTTNDDGTFLALPIPEPFVREMVADWWGAGKAITGQWDAVSWYIKNGEVMKLHPETRELVVQILDKSSSLIEGVTAVS
jgi:hypothetical protein